MIQVLLDVEEGIKKYVGQLAPLEVTKCDFTCSGEREYLLTSKIHKYRTFILESLTRIKYLYF